MAHLASGNVPVKYEVLPGGFHGTDATVLRMARASMGKYGARSPRIRALARNIIHNAGIREKDYEGEAVALGNWVKNNIRYMKDVVGQETLSYPEETAFNIQAGDCLAGDTLLLTPSGPVPIKDIQVGDTIWGKQGWTKVTNFWDKGVLLTKTYQLSNGGSFTATDDHRCFLSDGTEVLASDLEERSSLLSPEKVTFQGNGNLLPVDCYLIGLFISDGWKDGKKICISGKDGHPKEAQKRWVQQYAQLRGWRSHWHSRYITIYPDGYIGDVLYGLESHAINKEISKEVWEDLTQDSAKELLRGLMADSYDPEHFFTKHTQTVTIKNGKKRRGGLCFGSISDRLALQVRLLFKSLGITTRDTLVVNHGGLGDHPIHRVYPRMYRAKPILVEHIEDAGLISVYDIETEDHGIYLPEADTVVHNCDDKSTLLAALLGAAGIQSRFKVIGVTPLQYSHVYLQAKPGKRWITMDPIMTNKPIGWEVPAARRPIEKTYPINLPGGFRGDAGVDGMNGLGYVGDPRVVSHLEEPFIPYEAGSGRRPARAPTHPAYVRMPSGLDTDAPIDPLMAFPPNQNIPQRYPGAVASSVAPQQRQLTNAGVEPAMHPAEQSALHGQFDVIGPDALAGLQGHMPPPNMSVPAYMQTKTVVQRPEGIDDQFARAAMVIDPHKGDKVEYYGHFDGQEKPPIRPYQNLSGVYGADPREMMPGMGYFRGESLAGPGMGQDATGNDTPPEQMPVAVAAPGMTTTSKFLLAAAAVGAGLFLMRRKRRA